jgi:hypothetical protein
VILLKKCILLIAVLLILLFSLVGCTKSTITSPLPSPSSSETQSRSEELPEELSGKLIISFDFQRQSGHASNQFAVWIEDADGGYVKTLYATRFTAKGGYKNRPDSIPLWVGRSDLAAMSDKQVDAITGATPQTGAQEYSWDLTDESGKLVSAGMYKFFVEGSLRWKNRVLYSGEISLDNVASTVIADEELIYEESTDQPPLSDDSPESSMIAKVEARHVPKEP